MALNSRTTEASKAAPAQANSNLYECELKYLASLEALSETLDFDRLPALRLAQHYFSPKLMPLMTVLLADLSGGLNTPKGFRPSQARIRYTKNGKQENFELCCKGPYLDARRTQRVELSVEISSALYHELELLSDHGMIEKIRYTVPGWLKHNRQEIPLCAEVDVPLKAGKQQKPFRCGALEVAFVEVELPALNTVESLRRGQHTFTFLKSALEVNAQPAKLQRLISNRRLARKWPCLEAQKAISQLIS